MYKDITCEIKEGVAVLSLNLPKTRNAMSLTAMQELLDGLNKAEDNPDVGAVMITGSGDKAFCSGFHLREIPLDDGDKGIREHFRVAAMWWHQLLHKIVRVRLPVLAAVNGVAAGGGFGVSLACDMAVCSDDARFVCAWHTIGIGNDTATSYSLARIVGMRRAMDLMLTNRTLGAEEAAEWGIVSRIYPSASLKEKAFSIAKDLANAPTHLQVMAKNRFHAGWTQPIEECTEYEIQNVLSSVSHPHFRPRLLSFLQGNKADKPQVEFPS
ncbi:MAG: enoyl-CoA hydratase/isomerase family protein [Pseudorhodoplanes sp.]|uniref:enoyl-CoA hydratase/isomerase family protein n=1 Tax=Pseudorhodoplanes sp. TaxID=1934341 RepID=UPI003D14CB83